MKENSGAGRSYPGTIAVTIYFALFAYVALRAYHLSFTHDESLSYTILKGNESLKNTANHHVLNTYLMECCSWAFGGSELSLRLPNVLSFFVYLFCSYKLLKDTNRTV